MTSTLPTSAVPTAQTANLYPQIQHFYSRQMQLLDAGATAEWAQTFTEDGVFEAGGHGEPVRGRATIAAAAEKVAAGFVEAGVIRRHWIGMLTVDIDSAGVLAGQDGDTVLARSYALVLEIPQGGDVNVRRSTLCEDTLVCLEHGWLVKYRRITRDGLD